MSTTSSTTNTNSLLILILNFLSCLSFYRDNQGEQFVYNLARTMAFCSCKFKVQI